MFFDSDEEADDALPPEEAPRRDAKGVQVRYFLVPSQGHWELCDNGVAHIGTGATAAYRRYDWWQGGFPVPKPPVYAARPWLLPVTEEWAAQIARRQQELRAVGWRVPRVSEDLIAALGSKDGLHRLAVHLGLLDHVPRRYDSAEDAHLPCVVKPFIGCAGRHVTLVHSAEELTRALAFAARHEPGPMLLQEWVPGPIEYATSMVLRDGEILAACTCEYKYDRPDYTWPRCHEIGRQTLPPNPAHLRVLRRFLVGFSGVCNANYKLVWPGGALKLLEINPRVGGDLGTDVSRTRAASMLETLDLVETLEQEGRVTSEDLLRAGVKPLL